MSSPTSPEMVEEALKSLTQPGTAARWVWFLFAGLLAVGIVAIVVLAVRDRQALWLTYLADFLLVTGMAQSGVVWVSVTRGCNGRWARPLHRISESLSITMPLSVLLFIPLMIAHRAIFIWWDDRPRPHYPWLAHGFLLSRDLGILIYMSALSVYFVYRSLRPDLADVAAGRPAPAWQRWCVRGWRGLDAERTRREATLSRLWVVVLFSFVYLYSVLGCDLNMSLNVHWYDYIYGWFFFITVWYSGLALISILAVTWRMRLDRRDLIDANILHDQGEIMFGFTIFWAYLFWAQFMVLWFANRQDDITVLLRLSQQHPWITISWITLALAFFLPFCFGLSRSFKRRGSTLALIASFSLAGLWLAHNLIVDVSIWGHGFPPLLASAFVACGFLGLYGLVYLWFLAQVPAFPVQDPWLAEALVIHPVRH